MYALRCVERIRFPADFSNMRFTRRLRFTIQYSARTKLRVHSKPWWQFTWNDVWYLQLPGYKELTLDVLPLDFQHALSLYYPEMDWETRKDLLHSKSMCACRNKLLQTFEISNAPKYHNLQLMQLVLNSSDAWWSLTAYLKLKWHLL